MKLLDAIHAIPDANAVIVIERYLLSIEPHHAEREDVVQHLASTHAQCLGPPRVQHPLEPCARLPFDRAAESPRVLDDAEQRLLHLGYEAPERTGEADAIDADAALLELERELLGRVEATRTRRWRADRRRWAMAALLRHVHGVEAQHLSVFFPSLAATWKAIERGRERVILPLLDGDERPVARGLRESLLRSRRRDRGRSRAPGGVPVAPRYGLWTTICELPREPGEKRKVRVRCVCGVVCVRVLYGLRSGKSRGCHACRCGRPVRKAA